jgi:organic radical activating enzyme
MSVEEIKKKIEELGFERTCITGGEPLIQDFLPLG